MFSIENNNITMTKGDSGCFVIKLENGDGTEYNPQDGDKIVFSVKQRKEEQCSIVLKKTGAEIIFEASDTEKIPSGEYVYDVFLEKETKERQTVIEGKFVLRKAVHIFE